MAYAGGDKTRSYQREKIAATDEEKEQSSLAMAEVKHLLEFRQQGRGEYPRKEIEEKNPA